jgi:hypothetical protein
MLLAGIDDGNEINAYLKLSVKVNHNIYPDRFVRSSQLEPSSRFS